MAYGIIGKKVGMTQVFTDDGTRHPITVIQAGPCVVLQKKTKEHDGYNALQLGFDSKPTQWKSKNEGGKKGAGVRRRNSVTRPLAGHLAKANKGAFHHIKEFRMDDVEGFEVGHEIDASDFTPGDILKVTGTSKGKGFQGVVKRWGMSGGPTTHGSRSHRVPGSIGCCATPSRTFKNKKLPGQTGNGQVTMRNLFLMSVDEENRLLFVRGAVPGPNNGVVYVQKIKL